MKLLKSLLWAAAMAFAGGAHAQGFPDRAITLVSPYAPGGPVDVLARLLGKGLTDNLKQPLIVVNKAGAGAAIGASFVAHSPPDGYTVLLGTAAAHYITPGTTQTNYALDDFRFIGMVDNAANMLVVDPKTPVRTLKEFIAWAKSQPGKLNYGSSGIGTSPHIGMEIFKQRAGIDLVHVPYKGAAPAVIDLLEGHVQAGLLNMSGVLPFIKSGKLRPIAYAANERSVSQPDVPTFAEAGLPGFTSGSWHSLAVPAATPQKVVDRLVQALQAVQASAEFRQALASQGTEPFVLGPRETTAFIADEASRTLELFRVTHMQLN